jgi:hypothetical protein
MSVPVDIYVKDDSPFTNPISGVFVSVLDPTTFVVVASATTDVTGRAAFVIPGAVTPGTPYEARFFKLGVRFANPKQILVEDPPVTTNKFDMSGTLLVLPAATDPRVCRCTGRFVSFSNTPIANATVRFMALVDAGYQVPKVVDGNLVSAEAYTARTNADGFLSLDLIRGAQYYITFSGEDDTVWNICVPDRASVNLIELIHPAPVQLKWDPTEAPLNAVSVHVGQTKVVHFTLVYSDYEETGVGAAKWIKFINSNDALASVGFSSGTVSVEGIAVGVVNVTTEMLSDLKPVRVPAYNVVAPTLVVTVIP